jgi:hypothetical protein
MTVSQMPVGQFLAKCPLANFWPNACWSIFGQMPIGQFLAKCLLVNFWPNAWQPNISWPFVDQMSFCQISDAQIYFNQFCFGRMFVFKMPLCRMPINQGDQIGRFFTN